MRREAVDRVQNVISLYQLLNAIREECEPLIFTAETPLTEKIANHELFHDPDLRMEHWMIHYMFCPKMLARFHCQKIHTLFNVSEKELEQFHPQLLEIHHVR